MAKKKSRASRISNGGRKKANLHKEEKRQAKFAAKRGTDKEYKYTPNPYEKGTPDYYAEQFDRAVKNNSKKLPIAQWDSMMKKLDNELEKEKEIAKEFNSKKKTKKVS